MIKYATRLPPGKPVELLDNGNVRKTARAHTLYQMFFMDSLLKGLIAKPVAHIVPVYDYRIISREGTDFTYQYDMMRCGLLSAEERELINLVGNLHDKHKTKACEQELYDLQFYSKRYPALFDFLKMIVEQDEYWDIHSGNILMNEDGEYCLIDLEGFTVPNVKE